MGWFSNLTKGIGKAFNNITGVTSQQDRQEKLANSAHQREVDDLQKAGLNPVLSAGGGGGDGAGNVSTASPSANPLELALNTAKTVSDIEKQDAETKNIDANTAGQTQQQQWNPKIWTAGIELQNANSAKARAEKEKTLVETVEAETRIKLNNIKAEMAGMDRDKRKKFYDEEIEIMREQIITQMTDAGFNNTTMGIILRAIGKSVDNMSPLTNSLGHSGNTYNFTQSAPTVNY